MVDVFYFPLNGWCNAQEIMKIEVPMNIKSDGWLDQSDILHMS